MRKYICLFLFIAAGVCQHVQSQNIDIDITKSIYDIDNKFVKGYSKVASNSAFVIPVAVPLGMAVYGLIADDRDVLASSVNIGATLTANIIITIAMKEIIARQRPYQRYPQYFNTEGLSVALQSFPSGHASTAFAFATALSLEYPKWYIIAPSMFWASSVGFSRLNLGVHYPSDVLAGAALGAGCAYLSFKAKKYWVGLLKPKQAKTNTAAMVAYTWE